MQAAVRGAWTFSCCKRNKSGPDRPRPVGSDSYLEHHLVSRWHRVTSGGANCPAPSHSHFLESAKNPPLFLVFCVFSYIRTCCKHWEMRPFFFHSTSIFTVQLPCAWHSGAACCCWFGWACWIKHWARKSNHNLNLKVASRLPLWLCKHGLAKYAVKLGRKQEFSFGWLQQQPNFTGNVVPPLLWYCVHCSVQAGSR